MLRTEIQDLIISVAQMHDYMKSLEAELELYRYQHEHGDIKVGLND